MQSDKQRISQHTGDQDIPLTKLPSLKKNESKFSQAQSSGAYDDDSYYDEYDGEDSDMETEQLKKKQLGPKIIKDSEIFELLVQKIKNDIMDLTSLDFDKSLLIFQHYQFSQEKFNLNFFNESENINKKYGLLLENEKHLDNLEECLICFDGDTEGIQLPCGNQYCYDCVASHIQSKTSQKQVFFGCMEENCNYYFTNSFILKVFQKKQLDKDMKIYKTNLSRTFAEECNGIKWCPGLDCEYCVQDEYSQYQNVECDNGHKFCFKCRLPKWHKPCPCKYVEDWNTKNAQSSLDEKWIQANTRKCPHCSRQIQRSMGCDFMKCQPPGGCGKAFCYVCAKPITEAQHMEHASCKIKAAGEAVKQQQEAKMYLEKVEKYFNQVKVCEVVQEKAKEILDNNLENTRLQLYNKLGFPFQETQFLQDSLEILIDSRDALKYSYIFGFQQFQLHGKMKNSQALFEDFQSVYENHCERLAVSLDIELDKFLETIKGYKNFQDVGVQNPEKSKEFFILKEKINSQAQSINKSKQQMIEAVENGDIFLDEKK